MKFLRNGLFGYTTNCPMVPLICHKFDILKIEILYCQAHRLISFSIYVKILNTCYINKICYNIKPVVYDKYKGY